MYTIWLRYVQQFIGLLLTYILIIKSNSPLSVIENHSATIFLNASVYASSELVTTILLTQMSITIMMVFFLYRIYRQFSAFAFVNPNSYSISSSISFYCRPTYFNLYRAFFSLQCQLSFFNFYTLQHFQIYFLLEFAMQEDANEVNIVLGPAFIMETIMKVQNVTKQNTDANIMLKSKLMLVCCKKPFAIMYSDDRK